MAKKISTNNVADGGMTESTGSSQTVGVFNFETKTVLLNSGYEMPLVGLGAYSLGNGVCVNSVSAHLKSGGRLIDTAFRLIIQYLSLSSPSP